jgi:glycosyltransferase involved in cell wall biosynthesis
MIIEFIVYSKFKKLIPVWLKKIPWFIFKSPQRKLGFKTLWIEFKGLLSLTFYRLFVLIFSPKLKPISICTGLKNRSSNYLDIFLESVSKLEHKKLIELSVFDCASDDIFNLETEIRKKWKGKLVFNRQKVRFSRSFAFNKAVVQCNNSLVFICDADMSLPKNLVKQCNLFVISKNVWFPICYNLNKGYRFGSKKIKGQWYPVGKGMFGSRKSDFINIGMYNESIIEWGGEDWELWFRFYQNGFYPYRNKQKGLYHHYHKSLKPVKFAPFEVCLN